MLGVLGCRYISRIQRQLWRTCYFRFEPRAVTQQRERQSFTEVPSGPELPLANTRFGLPQRPRPAIWGQTSCKNHPNLIQRAIAFWGTYDAEGIYLIQLVISGASSPYTPMG